MLDIPEGPSNLVYQAIQKFAQSFSIPNGWECQLEKQIPAGAGMGGASSDAASALLCAAAICDVDASDPKIDQIAATIGSDVPFFLGQRNAATKEADGKPDAESSELRSLAKTVEANSQPDHLSQGSQVDNSRPLFVNRTPYQAARATGRGTALQPVSVGVRPSLVVAFPGVNLSTAKVYQHCRVPESPESADVFLEAWESGDPTKFNARMMNRLAEPARKLSHQIDEMLESMWHSGARTCQLTGSGSACFAIVESAEAATRMAEQMQASTGWMTKAVTLANVPAQMQFQRL